MRERDVAVVILALCAIVTARMTAQDTAFNVPGRVLLQRAAAPWIARGLTPSEGPRFGLLLSREADTVALTLRAGTRYVIIGVCDEDCGDLDLRLFDDGGKQLAADDRSDSHPVVSIVPPTGGTYRLKVSMAKCSTPPCYYGLLVLEKPEPGQATP